MLHSTEIKAELLRREPDGAWPGGPLVVLAGDVLRLESVGFAAPLAAFYRTSGMRPPGDVPEP